MKKYQERKEKKKQDILDGKPESEEEERPHDKFTRQIDKENPLSSEIFSNALQLKEDLNRKVK